MSEVRIRMARRDDAFIVAALVLQMDRASGAPGREGFLDEYADAWLADFDQRPTWLACLPDETTVGLLQAGCFRKMPSLRRPSTSWMHVSLVYVRETERRQGIAERLLRRMITWGIGHRVERYQLNAVPRARTLYERVGFTAPNDRFMELIVTAEPPISPYGRSSTPQPSRSQ